MRLDYGSLAGAFVGAIVAAWGSATQAEQLMDQCFENLAVRSGQAHQRSSVEAAIDLTSCELTLGETQQAIRLPQHAQAEPAKASDEMPASPGGTEDLAKQSQNPIANLISLPIEFNTISRVGLSEARSLNIVSFKPVIPAKLGSSGWSLITRTIIPFVNAPTSDTGRQAITGIGDINPQFFFVPESKNGLTWGVGPVLTLPTASNERLGSGKWSGGPGAVVVVTTDNLVFGAIANNQWSFAGSSRRDNVNSLLVQPFVNVNLDSGWYLVSSPVITANWQNSDQQGQWTVPIGGGFGRVFPIGSQQVNATLQAYWNAAKPEGEGTWSARAQITFLFPR